MTEIKRLRLKIDYQYYVITITIEWFWLRLRSSNKDIDQSTCSYGQTLLRLARKHFDAFKRDFSSLWKKKWKVALRSYETFSRQPRYLFPTRTCPKWTTRELAEQDVCLCLKKLPRISSSLSTISLFGSCFASSNICSSFRIGGLFSFFRRSASLITFACSFR